MQIKVRLGSRPIQRWARLFSKQTLLRAVRVTGPTLVALTFAGVAHAQGTMDFSGAQTLMGTFKTFAVYAGAVIRVLAAIGSAVPVRLMKRDLQFVVERLAGMLDENRLAIVAKQHGIKKTKDNDSVAKLFAAYLRRVEESALGRIMVELTIVLAASRSNPPQMLKDAAAVYKVDIDAIASKVKQEFAAKEKAKKVTAVVRPKPPESGTVKPRQAAA
jgi:hypothetical protein